jgi:hypothetical protein
LQYNPQKIQPIEQPFALSMWQIDLMCRLIIRFSRLNKSNRDRSHNEYLTSRIKFLSWQLNVSAGFLALEAFSYKSTDVATTHFSFEKPQFVSAKRSPHYLSEYCPTVCPYRVLAEPPTGLNPTIQSGAELPFSVAPVETVRDGAGILTCLPSATPFGLAFGSD